jgi:two-component system chemotaxis sensor kinase CheA
MDMAHYRELFLSETREHINSLNKLVVILEQTPDSRETIDALFREAHSIKGMAATMGYERTAQLSHHLEDLIDGFRSSGEVPGAVVDYLLAGIDQLDELLNDLENDRPEKSIEEFLQQPFKIPKPATDSIQQKPLQQIAGDDVIEISEELSEPTVSRTAVSQEASPSSDKSEVFQVLVDLAEDTPASAARCVLILRELEKLGELISSSPDLASLHDGTPCFKVQAWLSTALARGHIEEALLRISGTVKVRFIKDRRRKEFHNSDAGARTVRIRTDLLDQFVNLAGELITQRHMLGTATTERDWNGLTNALNQTGRLIDDLHHQVLQARLMPLDNISGRLPRIVRDLSRKTGKNVSLQIIGTEVGIDRAILEELTDPLVHLVRNAIDHGIEAEGTVTVTACRERDHVLIEVADDGSGMDPALIRRKALERGLLTPAQAEALNDRDSLMLVCQPGFSTAGEVTETSGRGVGMDVVKAAVGNLGGTLDIVSSPGQGTRFQMRLPLSVAIIKVLLVDCAGRPLAIPLTRILRTLDLPASAIMASGQTRGFHLDDEFIGLYSLAAAIGQNGASTSDIVWIVLTEINGRRIGLQVDRLLGHRDAFVKSLGFPMNLLNGLSGATIEGNGQIVFIIDPQALFEKHPVL